MPGQGGAGSFGCRLIHESRCSCCWRLRSVSRRAVAQSKLGPQPEMRKAGLRLDLAEAAFKKRPGHPDAIVPGDPDRSELIRRIESKDPHHLMPQTAQGEAKPMKPEEIAILREWVKEGAVYRPHW